MQRTPSANNNARPERRSLSLFGMPMSCRGDLVAVELNRQLDSELNLARRTGFTRRKSGAGDSAESRGAHDIPRLAEVCMIEQIEKLGAKLRAKLFAELSVLNNREIGVVEAGADNDVAAQIPKPRDG